MLTTKFLYQQYKGMCLKQNKQVNTNKSQMQVFFIMFATIVVVDFILLN